MTVENMSDLKTIKVNSDCMQLLGSDHIDNSPINATVDLETVIKITVL